MLGVDLPAETVDFNSGADELHSMVRYDDGLQLLHKTLCHLGQQAKSSSRIRIGTSLNHPNGNSRLCSTVLAFDSDFDDESHLVPQGCSRRPILSPPVDAACPCFWPLPCANFVLAAGRRRTIDRTLMLGEWPVLLRVMRKEGQGGRYLDLLDVIDLFKNRRFPVRMSKPMRIGS